MLLPAAAALATPRCRIRSCSSWTSGFLVAQPPCQHTQRPIQTSKLRRHKQSFRAAPLHLSRSNIVLQSPKGLGARLCYGGCLQPCIVAHLKSLCSAVPLRSATTGTKHASTTAPVAHRIIVHLKSSVQCHRAGHHDLWPNTHQQNASTCTQTTMVSYKQGHHLKASLTARWSFNSDALCLTISNSTYLSTASHHMRTPLQVHTTVTP
jgi:hypothetical protein